MASRKAPFYLTIALSLSKTGEAASWASHVEPGRFKAGLTACPATWQIHHVFWDQAPQCNRSWIQIIFGRRVEEKSKNSREVLPAQSQPIHKRLRPDVFWRQPAKLSWQDSWQILVLSTQAARAKGGRLSLRNPSAAPISPQLSQRAQGLLFKHGLRALLQAQFLAERLPSVCLLGGGRALTCSAWP